MTKILFICLGNICRSPMAEFVMKDLVEKAGLADEFQIDSAATCRDEIGNPVYPPARRKLAEHGISCEGHAARQLTAQAMKSIYAELTKGGQKLNRKITKEQVADAVAASVSHLPGIDTVQVRKLFLSMTGTAASDESNRHDQ